METRTYKVYKFDELPDESKEKAVEKYRDFNVDHEWWDSLYEDAKTIGLEIEGFDTYRHTIHGKALLDDQAVKALVMKNHGKMTETYKTVKGYDLRKKKAGYPINGGQMVYDLLQCYLSLLEQEYEYLTSDEAIIEAFRANEYDFTEEGAID